MKRVYFMRRVDGVGPVKIGCTEHGLTRLDHMQAWSPEPLTIVASVPGDFGDEKRLHRQFDHCRLHGEWFEATPALLSVIAKCASSGVLPPPQADDKWQRIAVLYRSGKTLQEIGDEFGFSRERARQILRKSGVATLGYRDEHKRQSIAARNADQVIAMARGGSHVEAIAEAVGDCQMNVRTVLKRAGVTAARKKRDRNDATLTAAFAVAADYRAGLKGSVIAEKHGIQQPTIYHFLRIAGVKPERSRGAGKRRAA